MFRFKLFLTATPFLICAAGLNQASLAQDQATPEEVVQKVKEAAEYLGEAGEAGLETFQSKDSEYVWKDTYVVVNDCEAKILAAHPIRPDLAGTSMTDMPAFGDDEPGQIGAMMCESGQRPEGGWVEYLFPKPGEKEPSRKISYSVAVKDSPYVVTGGIYSEDATVEELEQIISE